MLIMASFLLPKFGGMHMRYGIFFNYKNEIIRLPVNPEFITVREKGDNKTYQVLKLGEINVLGDKKLAEINMDILLPGEVYPFVTTKNDFRGPSFYLQKFQEYKDTKEGVRLVITGDPMGINMLVSFETEEKEVRAGEEQDVYVRLELKEYREYSLDTFIPVVENGKVQKVYVQNGSTRQDTKPKITEYVVQQGDDFYRVAKKLTGDGARAVEVAQHNGMNVLDVLIPGQVLRWK